MGSQHTAPPPPDWMGRDEARATPEPPEPKRLDDGFGPLLDAAHFKVTAARSGMPVEVTFTAPTTGEGLKRLTMVTDWLSGHGFTAPPAPVQAGGGRGRPPLSAETAAALGEGKQPSGPVGSPADPGSPVIAADGRNWRRRERDGQYWYSDRKPDGSGYDRLGG